MGNGDDLRTLYNNHHWGKTKSYIQTHTSCSATTGLWTELGFLIHAEKSMLSYRHDVIFPGVRVDTSTMHISLPWN